MSVRGAQETSLRLERLEYTRLAWAFGISLAVHLLCFAGYESGKEFGLWNRARWPVWLQKINLLAAARKPPAKPPPELHEVPLVFVDVNPAQATAEPPKNTPFYSDKNSQAANPDADRDTGAPKIAGTQTEIPKTEDVPRMDPNKLHPSPPAAAGPEQPAERAKPKPKPGELAMIKPDLTLRPPDTGTHEQTRPRTIREAMQQQHLTQLPGQRMKQEGGVPRLSLESSLDVKLTPYGAYDAAFIGAVQSRWDDLLDQISYDGYRRGKVVVQFRLNYDGTITDLKVVDNTVSDMLAVLCEKAVLDPQPYDHWPREMRLTVDKDYRDITFTFLYN